MRGIALLIAVMLFITSFSVVAAQKSVPPGQIGKSNLPPGQIRKQFTYGNFKELVPVLCGFLGCCIGTVCCPPIGNIIGAILGYLLGDALVKPNVLNR